MTLLPQQHLAVPLLAYFGDIQLASLPRAVQVAKPSPYPLLVFDVQHIMPADLLAQLDQPQVTETAICQQGAILVMQTGYHFSKEPSYKLPLAFVATLLLGASLTMQRVTCELAQAVLHT